MRDLVGANSPQRRCVRIISARFTRRETAALEDGDIAVLTVGIGGNDARVILGHCLERADEAVAEVFGQRNAVGGDGRAIRLLDAHIANGIQRLRLTVVDQLVGLQGVVFVIDLDVALGDDAVVLAVGDELVSLQQQRLIGGVLAYLRLGHDIAEHIALLRHGRCAGG